MLYCLKAPVTRTVYAGVTQSNRVLIHTFPVVAAIISSAKVLFSPAPVRFAV